MSRENMIREYEDLINAFADPFASGEIVYHYTSAEGFRGIVANNEIWLTNTAFVNDITECKAFWTLKRDEVLGSGSFPNKHVDEWWERGTTYRWEDDVYYIASFSRVKNLLEQWRAYGSFCIGFEASKLAGNGFYPYRCVYSSESIREWLHEKSCIEQWRSDHLDEMAKDGAAHSLLFAASMKYKDPNYEAEKEVRLISVSNHEWVYPNSPSMYEKQPPIHFRDHHVYRVPVPYVKFFSADHSCMPDESTPHNTKRETALEMKRRKLTDEAQQRRCLLPIKEVWIGPMAYQDEARIACEILLREKGYSRDVVVNVSKIPYRGD